MRPDEMGLQVRDSEASPTIPLAGSLLMLALCSLWGGNLVSIKISNQGIPPCVAAAARSGVAVALLGAFAWRKGEPVLLRGRDFRHGVAIGTLFGLDFLFMYLGTAWTHASRAVIFLYTYPFWVTLGAHLFIPNDRLTVMKVGGLVLAFAGLLLVFGSRSSTLGSRFWIGDLMEIASAIFWASAILYIKRVVRTREITHFQTAFAQLLFSIPVLISASVFLERGQTIWLTPAVIWAFAYQCLVVAFLSYLIWIWMIHRFLVSHLAAYTFLVPLFGVILSKLILGELLPPLLWGGLGLVAAGIYLVNSPKKTSHP